MFYVAFGSELLFHASVVLGPQWQGFYSGGCSTVLSPFYFFTPKLHVGGEASVKQARNYLSLDNRMEKIIWWLANASLLALWCTSAQLGFLGNSFFCHSWSWHLTTAAVLFHFSCVQLEGDSFVLLKECFGLEKQGVESRILSGNRLF